LHRIAFDIFREPVLLIVLGVLCLSLTIINSVYMQVKHERSLKLLYVFEIVLLSCIIVGNVFYNKKAMLSQGNRAIQRIFAYIQWLFDCY